MNFFQKNTMVTFSHAFKNAPCVAAKSIADKAKAGLFVMTAAAILTGCGGGSSGSVPLTTADSSVLPSAPQSVSIEFAALANGKSIGCADTFTAGLNNATAKLADLRFYVSDIQMVKADGSSVPVTLVPDQRWQYSKDGVNVALIDLENAQGTCSLNKNGSGDTNIKIVGTVPQGQYVGIRYQVGVPTVLNHTDYTVAPAPLDNAAMAWNWQAGRKYLKIEVAPDGGVTRPATATTPSSTGQLFMVHLGATGCEGNPATGATTTCASRNLMPVTFSQFDATSQKIGVDVTALLSGSDITKDLGGAMGCMSGKTDPECPVVFSSLGLDLATGNAGLNSSQRLFTLIPK